jgi:flagellar hook-length control protein FliK
MLVVDKVLSGNENFEINLEPESFGKIKVNISMDKQSIDIRMFAETQAAASILRANEDSLLQITSQNGMKLAGFSVGMQSGADQQRQNANQSRNKAAGKANSPLERTTPLNTQTASSYRTPTGLNLIA